MTTTIEQLRAEMTERHRKANHLLAEKGARPWTRDEQADFDAEMEAADRLQTRITNMERLADKAVKADFKDARRMSAAEAKRFKATQMEGFDIFLRLSSDQWTAQEAVKVSNTMSTTTQSEGGFTLEPLVAGELIDSLKDYGAVRRVADYMRTDTGVPMSWPASDGRNEVGGLIAQNATATAADPVFTGTAPVNAFKFGSKVITVPIELLQDSMINITSIVLKRCRDRIGRSQNISFTNGTGTGEPFGLTVAAPVGKVGAPGDTTAAAINYDMLVDLSDSLDASYLQTDEGAPQVKGPAPGWMFNQTVRRALRKIKDTTGRPIWMPSYDKGITVAADMLMGYPVYLNNDMPSPAANAISVAFGNFSQYLVRDAMEVTLFRFEDSVYTQKGQIGFLAWARAGGNLLDQASVVTYKHSAT